MTTGKVKKKRSFADQLAELSNPTPITFHPDQEDLEDVTAAKVCTFDAEEESEEGRGELQGANSAVRGSGRRRRVKYLDEDDAKYAGKPVSRRELETEYEAPGSIVESDENESASELELDDSLEESEEEEEHFAANNSLRSFTTKDDTLDQSEEDMSSDQSGSEFSDREEGSASSTESTAEGDDITMVSLASIREDLEKGKAAEEQVSLFDGALEARIRLQKLLTLCNRLPQPATMSQFQQAGGQQLEETIKETQVKLRNLLDNLLGLQRIILMKNKETCSIVGGARQGSHGNDKEGSDEEIPSDSEEETQELEQEADDVTSDQSDDERKEHSTIARKRLKRKRKRPDWVTISGKRDYEGYIAKTHESLKSFRDSTVEKWSKRTKIVSGRITSKAFMQVDHSVLSQIEHVLKDKERLVKRTQLKRSVYRILGTSEEDDTASTNGANENTEEEERSGEADTHLHDYNPEIFDDDDFYHQLLRELIERKMSYTEGSDPTAMGRQWLELQKLRNKAKKKVDTKASKGRKIRYDVHPKLSSFMTPINKGSMSDISRNDLFSSLFGGRYSTMS